jgi:hypothetical protein
LNSGRSYLITAVQEMRNAFPETNFFDDIYTITIWSNILLVKLTLNIYKLCAYPSEYLWQEFKAIRVFLVAKVKDQKVMNAVEYEQDVLLGNFQESYKHLSFKHILGLTWATSR